MPILLASEVMDLAAAALNDIDKTVYDYDTQLPYLKLALQELQEVFELNSLAVTQQSTSDPIPVAAGITEIEFNAPSQPRLPDNLIEPQQLWERFANTNPWTPMVRKEFIPHDMAGVAANMWTYWVWQSNKIILLPSNGDNEIKIDYVGSLFPKYVREDTILPVQNGIGYLAYKTAELISDMVEHNQARAQTNGGRAIASLDRIAGITIKSKQQIVARRRPFRAGYKRATMW
jgi:hypothetical protein